MFKKRDREREKGRGLMQAEEAYVTETTKSAEYIQSKLDPLKQTVRTYHHNTNSLLPQTVQNLKNASKVQQSK